MSGDNGHGSDCGARRVGDLCSGQNVLNGCVGRHIKCADDEDAGDECDGKAALRALDFTCHHGKVVPAIVSPENGNHGDHKSAEPALRACEGGFEINKCAGVRAETKPGNDDDEDGLEPGENELEVSSFFKAQII